MEGIIHKKVPYKVARNYDALTCFELKGFVLSLEPGRGVQQKIIMIKALIFHFCFALVTKC